MSREKWSELKNLCLGKNISFFCISVTQENILSSQQIEARNVEEGLEGTKQKLKDLNQEISVEKQEDQKLEGVEGMIQRLITVRKHSL